MFDHLSAIIPIIHIFGIIQYLVQAESSFDVPSEIFDGAVCGNQLDTKTVTFIHIGHDGSSHVVDLPCKYKLFVIVHEVGVGVEGILVVFHTIAKFHIVQGFRYGSFILTAVGKVAAGGFTLRASQREIQAVVSVLVQVHTYAGFGVEKVP